MDLSQVPAELVLHSPFDEETIQLPSGQQVQLAADFTTPSLVQFSQSGLQALEYEGLLLPELVQKKASIYLNEPYRPGKIPVLFVHGLWSSPRTWTDMNNQLLADPEIRRNYQFFFALYPTGEPVLDSAMIIREKIRKLRDTFDPARQDPAWDQMVVVCHSMGGIVSRLLITDSGNTFENAFLAKPIEELTISDDTRNRLMQRLRFEPVPEISRVAFLAPVFRGSSFASRPIGRISSTLINKVDYLSEVRNEIVSNNGYESIKPAYRGAWIANGIDNLQPDNPTLKALDQTTPNPNTKYHVILGDNGKLLPKLRGMITDGLVTYQSGHLDGAESEVIFDANHYLNHDKPIIDEVHRVLRHHIGMSTIETIVENGDRNEIRR
jgi:pimeloyl-ACP methyl ester carboxylesterase